MAAAKRLFSDRGAVTGSQFNRGTPGCDGETAIPTKALAARACVSFMCVSTLSVASVTFTDRGSVTVGPGILTERQFSVYWLWSLVSEGY